MSKVVKYISEEKIAKRIKELGEQITREYAGKDLFIIGILNGAFVFCADLIKEIKAPLMVEFMAVSTYGDEQESSGVMQINLDLKRSIEGKDVLIIEDIVDTGFTISELTGILKSRKPKSLKLASFLYKPERLEHQVDIDYLGFQIDDRFVVGYGLDYAGRYRELPYVGIYTDY